MSISPDDFRKALSRFASGVTVVTAKTGAGIPTGVTVSAFSSVSLSPPLILVCLDHATTNLDAYTKGSGFCVNVLAAGQEAASNAFAFPGPVSPFEAVANVDGELGFPTLVDALAVLECRPHAVHPGGDHEIVVGEVVHTRWREDAKPLLYSTGRYRSLAGTDGPG